MYVEFLEDDAARAEHADEELTAGPERQPLSSRSKLILITCLALALLGGLAYRHLTSSQVVAGHPLALSKSTLRSHAPISSSSDLPEVTVPDAYEGDYPPEVIPLPYSHQTLLSLPDGRCYLIGKSPKPEANHLLIPSELCGIVARSRDH